MKIGVIGGGSWGTALAKLLADQGSEVQVWCYEADLVERINATHINDVYLPDITLPDNLVATNDLQEVAQGKELLVSSTPSHVLRSVLVQVADAIDDCTPIVSATKGIENDTYMLVSDILEDVLPARLHPYLTYLSGPSFAREVAQDKPTAVTVASYNHKLAQRVQKIFSTNRFRCYTTHDVRGVEVGGAVKNVIAIAAGAVSAMDLGLNSTAGMITRGLNEITRLGIKLGANPLTLSGLAGMGDLVLTCTGGLSRNRTVGTKLGQGMSLQEILEDMQMVAEGIKTSKSVYEMSVDLGVEMPLSHEVYKVVHEGKPAAEAVESIMTRDLKPELMGLYG